MIEFSYPLVFVLLLAPLLVYKWRYSSQKDALYFPNFGLLKKASGEDKEQKKSLLKASWSQKLILSLAYLLVVIALAKPILIKEPIVEEESLREILVCVDLSASMYAKDFKSKNGEYIDRLEAQKEVLYEFFDTLKGENFALIFYGSAAFVQSPFSNDTKAIKQLLSEAQISMAGPKTVIGDAIGLSIKLFNEGEVKDRLMILISDGTDTGSKVPPIKAAQLAKENNIKIQSIAVGNPNATGEERVDIRTLQKIAEITEGNFYFADNRESLLNIYKEINRLHPKRVKKNSYRPEVDLFRYALITSFLLLFIYLILVLLTSFIRKEDAE